jgi:hypothetical protein
VSALWAAASRGHPASPGRNSTPAMTTTRGSSTCWRHRCAAKALDLDPKRRTLGPGTAPAGEPREGRVGQSGCLQSQEVSLKLEGPRQALSSAGVPTLFSREFHAAVTIASAAPFNALCVRLLQRAKARAEGSDTGELTGLPAGRRGHQAGGAIGEAVSPNCAQLRREVVRSF